MTTNAGRVDGGRCWVPLQDAIVVCYGWRRHFFFTLITQKLVFVLSGVYAGIIFSSGALHGTRDMECGGMLTFHNVP